MADLSEPNLVLRIAPRSGAAVHTIDERRVKSYSIDSGYLTATDGFRLVVYDENPENLRGLERQPVEIIIDGKQQVVGQIDKVDIGDSGIAATLSGRDYLADIVEDRVNPEVKVSKDMSVADAILMVCAPQGIKQIEGPNARRNILTGISVGSPAPPRDFKQAKLDEYKAEGGEGAMAYIERLVARHGGTIQPSSRRDRLVIGAPDFQQAPSGTIRRFRDPAAARTNNVVGNPRCSRDWSSVPTIVVVAGKKSAAASGKGTLSSVLRLRDFAPNALSDLSQEVRDSIVDEIPAVGATPPAVDSERLFYRLLFHRDEQARNQEQLDRTARRLMSERLRETLKYEVTLRGHADPASGAMYAVDTTLDVVDEVCGIAETLWVANRTFEYERKRGATTKLECWRLNTFLL